MRTTLLVLLLLALAGTACAQGATVIEPPQIRYGEDVCAQCNMIISDPRFAAAYVHEVSPGRYESALFDDLGDMLMHADEHPENQIVAWYVHDYFTEEWLDATEAVYVLSEALKTPMAQGAAACADPADADRLAAELGGEVIDWESFLARPRSGGMGHYP